MSLCECGCGKATTIVTRNLRNEGVMKGESRRFVSGHQMRGRPRLPSWNPPYDEERRKEAILSRFRREGECLIWTGTLNDYGYGIVSWHGRYRLVHVLQYEWTIGPVPDGKELDHLCRRHACGEPLHLEAVTHRVNMLRGQTFAALHAAKTHCVHGHEFTPENTRIRRGARECRTCARDRQRRQTITA
jgi:hypothetical protein